MFVRTCKDSLDLSLESFAENPGFPLCEMALMFSPPTSLSGAYRTKSFSPPSKSRSFPPVGRNHPLLALQLFDRISILQTGLWNATPPPFMPGCCRPLSPRARPLLLKQFRNTPPPPPHHILPQPAGCLSPPLFESSIEPLLCVLAVPPPSLVGRISSFRLFSWLFYTVTYSPCLFPGRLQDD